MWGYLAAAALTLGYNYLQGKKNEKKMDRETKKQDRIQRKLEFELKNKKQNEKAERANRLIRSRLMYGQSGGYGSRSPSAGASLPAPNGARTVLGASGARKTVLGA